MVSDNRKGRPCRVAAVACVGMLLSSWSSAAQDLPSVPNSADVLAVHWPASPITLASLASQGSSTRILDVHKQARPGGAELAIVLSKPTDASYRISADGLRVTVFLSETVLDIGMVARKRDGILHWGCEAATRAPGCDLFVEMEAPGALAGFRLTHAADGTATLRLALANGAPPPGRPMTGKGKSAWFEGGSNYSFLSGHTAYSFAFASAFAHEYADTGWVPFVAYGLAGAVGLSRIHDDKHWTSDVVLSALVGWGVGQLVTELDPFGSQEALGLKPLRNGNAQGLSLNYKF